MRTNKRAVGIIIDDAKILVFRRFKEGRWYHAFIGGGVEEGETAENAMVREMGEEICIDVKEYKPLFMVETKLDTDYLFDLEKEPDKINKYSPYQYFYLITKFEGIPKLGGPEKERSCDADQYHLEWIPLHEIEEMPDLYPREGKDKLVEFIKANKL